MRVCARAIAACGALLSALRALSYVSGLGKGDCACPVFVSHSFYGWLFSSQSCFLKQDVRRSCLFIFVEGLSFSRKR